MCFFVAHFKLIIRFMHFKTIWKQVHFYLFDLQSRTLLTTNISPKIFNFSIFLTPKWDTTYSTIIQNGQLASRTHYCIILFLSAKSITWLLNCFPQFLCFCCKVPYYSSRFQIIVYTNIFWHFKKIRKWWA